VPLKDLDLEAESDDVTRLQTALQRLGYMDTVTGYYGEITADAVTNFQQDNGIYATGAYGAITRMALAARMRPPVASAPVVGEQEMARVGFVAFGIFPY
jgi:peptidoglycan hydrolase-like protein with peptidoglycan-binding domain